MWKHIAANALTLLIVGAVIVMGLIGGLQRSYTQEGPLAEAIFFEVPRGASLGRVSDALEAQGAIASSSQFRILARLNGRDQGLKFGNYEIPSASSPEEILDILSKGGASVERYTATLVIRNQGAEMRIRERVPGSTDLVEIATFDATQGSNEAYEAMVQDGVNFTYRIIAAPGLTSWQIKQGILSADFLSGEITELPAEGYLAPNTYQVARGTERQALINRMKEGQAKAVAEVWESRTGGLPLANAQEMLTLASIVEKETSLADERGLVASVFINRLNVGMKLQTDPTVIYGVTKGQGILGRGLRRSELRQATDYNTYVIEGLPPTPIANPSRAAMEAVVNPEQSDYIFFVADGTGGHAFSRTLAEHNANVAKWRKIEAQRNAQ